MDDSIGREPACPRSSPTRSEADDIPTELEAAKLKLTYLITAGSYAAAPPIAARLLEQYSQLANSDAGVGRSLAALRTLQAVAIARSSEERTELESARQILRGVVNEESKAGVSYYTLAAIELAALESRRGHPHEAERVLDRLERTPLSQGRSDASLGVLRTRVAARRFEVARVLFPRDAEQRKEATSALRQELAKLIEAWRELDEIPGGVGFLSYHEWLRILSVLVDETLASGPEGATLALDIVLEADACSTVAQRLGASASRSEDILRDCRETGTAVVVLLPTPSLTHRFVVEPAGISHEYVADAQTLKRLSAPIVESLLIEPVEAIGTDPTDAVAEDKQALAVELIPSSIRDTPERFSGVTFWGWA